MDRIAEELKVIWLECAVNDNEDMAMLMLDAAGIVEANEAVTAQLGKAIEILETISTMPNYDQDDAHRMRNIAKQALSQIKEGDTDE